MTQFLRQKKNTHGLSLVEFLAILAILAVIAAVIVTAMVLAHRHSQYDRNKANVVHVTNTGTQEILLHQDDPAPHLEGQPDYTMMDGMKAELCWYVIARVDKLGNISNVQPYVYAGHPEDDSPHLLKAEGSYQYDWQAPTTPEEFYDAEPRARDYSGAPYEQKAFKRMKPDYWVLIWVDDMDLEAEL